VKAICDVGVLLGRQINTLATALGPQRVVMTGALAAAGDLLLDPIRAQVHGQEIPLTHKADDVVLGGRRGIDGAAHRAVEMYVWGPARADIGWTGHAPAVAMLASR